MSEKPTSRLTESERKAAVDSLLKRALQDGYVEGDRATNLKQFFDALTDGNTGYLDRNRGFRHILPGDAAVIGALRGGAITLGYLREGDGLAVDAFQVLIEASLFKVDFPEIEIPPDFPRKK